MKKYLIILALLIGRHAIGQQLLDVGSPSITVQYQNVFVKNSFAIPVFSDTLAANRIKSLDSSGKFIKTYNPDAIWSRAASPKRWVRFQAAITITNAGTSGPATIIRDTLNIPNYNSGTVTNVSGNPPLSFATATTTPIGSIDTTVRTYGLKTIAKASNDSSTLASAIVKKVNDGTVLSQTLTFGTTTTLDASQGRIATITLTGNTNLSVVNPLPNTYFDLTLIQDAIGNRVVTWPLTFKWKGGVAPVLTTNANAVDVVSCKYNGTNYLCNSGLDYR